MPNIKEIKVEYLLQGKEIDADKLKLLNKEHEKIVESLIEKQKLNRSNFPPASGKTMQESYDY